MLILLKINKMIDYLNKRLSVLNPYLGPSFNDKEIENLIKKFNLKYQKITNINKKAASLICKNKIIGYFQGRGEIGPRSLGARLGARDPLSFPTTHRRSSRLSPCNAERLLPSGVFVLRPAPLR